MLGEEQKAILNNMSLLEIIRNMPQEQVNEMIEELNNKLGEVPDTILSSAVIAEIKTEYEDIGIDTKKLQNDYIFFAGLRMLGVALLSMACAVIIMLLSSRVAAKLGKLL